MLVPKFSISNDSQNKFSISNDSQNKQILLDTSFTNFVSLEKIHISNSEHTVFSPVWI